MFEILKIGKIIINFDETVIKATTGRNLSWDKKGAGACRLHSKKIDNLSLMAAISSKGDVFY